MPPRQEQVGSSPSPRARLLQEIAAGWMGLAEAGKNRFQMGLNFAIIKKESSPLNNITFGGWGEPGGGGSFLGPKTILFSPQNRQCGNSRDIELAAVITLACGMHADEIPRLRGGFKPGR